MDYSKSLDIILDKYINMNTYGEISEVLKHIFQKRACEFEFSDEEMENQIKTFCENCKSINFISTWNILDGGSFSMKEKTVNVNNNPAKMLKLYKILTHEVYHAIHGKMLIYYDGSRTIGNALNEIITETAAKRTCDRKITSRNYLRTSAYETTTPVMNLLAITMGVSEKQLLKAGLQDRSKFMKLVYSKFPREDYTEGTHNKKVENLLKKIEINLDVIHNISDADEKIDKKRRKQIISSAIQTIEESAFELAAYQMNFDETLTPAEKAYRFKNMKSIIEYLKKVNKIKFQSTSITQDKKQEILSMDGVQEALANPDHKYEQQRFYEEHTNKVSWRDKLVQYKFGYINSVLSRLPEVIRNRMKLLMDKKSPKLLNSGKEEERHNDKSSEEIFRARNKVDLSSREESLPNNGTIEYTNPKGIAQDPEGEEPEF